MFQVDHGDDGSVTLVFRHPGSWPWSRNTLRVDRKGLEVDGDRVPLDCHAVVTDAFVIVDTRTRQWVLRHGLRSEELPGLQEILDRAMRQARAAHGQGRDDVPEALKKLT